MVSFKTGIYRSAKVNNNIEIPDNVDEGLRKFLKMWYSFGGNYCTYENIKGHDMLDLEAYVHITSPIRRLVDLLTMIIIQKEMGILTLSDDAYKFYDKWTKKLNR